MVNDLQNVVSRRVFHLEKKILKKLRQISSNSIILETLYNIRKNVKRCCINEYNLIENWLFLTIIFVCSIRRNLPGKKENLRVVSLYTNG